MVKKFLFLCSFLWLVFCAYNLHAQTCTYTVNMADSYGDGWGDLFLEIKQGGVPVDTFTLASGLNATQYLTVSHNLNYTMHWHSAMFASEASFEVLDVAGNPVFTCSNAQELADGQIFSFYGNCFGCFAVDPVVASVSQNSATLYWNSNAAGVYQLAMGVVEPDTLNPYTVQDTFYTITGLTSETTYQVSLRVVCDAASGEYSEWRSVAFTTSQAPATLPFMCNFEDETQTAQWGFANGTEVNQWRIGSATNHTENGQNALYISRDNGVTNSYDTASASAVYAYRDLYFPNTTNDFIFSFYWKNQGESAYCEPVKVYVGDVSPVQAGEGSYNLEIPGTRLLGSFWNNGTEWSEELFVLEAEEFAGSVQRIYFYFYSDTAHGANPAPAIDDIVLKELVCPEVDSVQLSDITANSVNIIPYSDYSVTSYMLYYKSIMDTVYMAVSIPSDGYTLTGLSSGTLYQYYLRADCGNEEYGLPSAVSSFYTQCDVVSVFPWQESFEGSWSIEDESVGNESAPMCWLNFNYASTQGRWEQKVGESVSGNSCASMNANNSNNSADLNNDWLLTPILSLTGNERLNFSVKKSNLSYVDEFSVYSIYINGDDVSDFDDVLANAYCLKPSTVATDEWVNYELSLASCLGNYRLAFVRNASPGGSKLYIDDVVVSTMPACPDVLHVEVNPASATSVAVNFSTDNSINQTWEIAYAPTSDSPFDVANATVLPVSDASSLPVIIDNLQAETSYTFAVRQACGGNWSDAVICDISHLVINSLPFTCDFENETLNSNWFLMQDTSLTNLWYIGDAIGSQSANSLYISSDDGVNNLYYTAEASFVVAYVDLAMSEAEQYLISFDWRCIGERNYDDLSVCLLPCSISLDSLDPSAGYLPDWVERYKLANNTYKLTSPSDNYTSVSVSVDAAPVRGTVRRLAFIWKNDDYSGSGYAASVDNISVIPITCDIPYNIAVSPGATDAVVSWTSTADEWLISYRTENEAWTDVQVYESTVLLEDLQPVSDYELKIYSLCDGDTGVASEIVTFSTFCVPDSVPYLEDFNDLSAPDFSINILPNSCWNVATGALGTVSTLSYDVAFSFWMPQNSEMEAGMEEHFGATLSYTNKYWLISPLINLGDGSQLYQLELDLLLTGSGINSPASTNNADDEFAIVISTDNGATWSRQNAFVWNNVDGAERVLNDLTGEVKHIIIPLQNRFEEPYMGNIMVAFYAGSSVSNANNTIRIDNFAINPFTQCSRPENLMVTDVQTDEISISWQPGAEESMWQAVIVPAGTPMENGELVDLVDTAYTFSNLQPATYYDIYLRSDCGYDLSLYVSVTALTACAPVNAMPLMEGFEGYQSGEYPICWQKVSRDSTNTFPSVCANNSATGSRALQFFAAEAPVFALLPEIDAELSIDTLQLSFKAKSSNYSVTPIFVGVMDSLSPNSFVAVDTFSLTSEYLEYQVSFEDYAGPGRYIAFRYQDSIHGYDVSFVDDVFVDYITNCSAPHSLEISQVRANEATLSWNADEGVSEWHCVLIEGMGNADFSDYTSVNTNSFQMDDLQPNTTYTVYLRSVCPDGISHGNWTNISFSTTPAHFAETPYSHDFENYEENEKWVLVNGEAVNRWRIGSPEADGDSVMYVSNSDTSFTYLNVKSVVWAYRDVLFNAASEYELSFNWRCEGENVYDNLSVYLGDLTDVQALNGSDVVVAPSGTVRLGAPLHSSPTWQRFTVLLDETYSDRVQRLYFCWRNDNGTNGAPAAIVDSIQILSYACARPNGLLVESIHPTSAQLRFVPAYAEDSSWEYVITAVGENPNTATPVAIADSIFTIANLMAETSYTVYVRTVCGADENSEWSNPVTFTTLIACPEPIMVSVDNISDNAALVTWQDLGSATQWSVEYGPAGFTHGQGTLLSSTENQLNLTALASATTYDLYVRANCSASEQSEWSDKVTFTTECAAVSVFPFVEGFEEGSIPDCWRQDYLEGTVNWYVSNGTGDYTSLNSAFEGSHNALFASYNYDGHSTRLISPIFDLSQLTEPKLSFWYAIPNWDDEVDELHVYYRTSAAADWQLLVSHTTDTPQWTSDTLLLPNPSASYQIAFDAVSNYGYGVAIDQVYVGETQINQPCDAPTNVQITPAETSATVTWTSAASAWVVEYKEVSASNWTASATLATNSYNITGLNESTDYQVRVKAICDNANESDWSAIASFTTLDVPVMTYTITATATGPGSITPSGAVTVQEGSGITFTFTPDAGAVVSNLLVDEVSTAIPADNSYSFTSVVSNHTITVEFEEETGIEELDLDAAVVLYPNPATSHIQINVADARFLGAEMQIFDAYGKLIANTTVEALSTQVDVSQLANGMYMVRISANDGMVTKRFVKR